MLLRMWKKDMEQLIKYMDYCRLELEQELDNRIGLPHFDTFCETDDSDSCCDTLNMPETFV